MEELDPFLSGSTRNILLRCINTQSACTAEEDIDGTVYTVEMIRTAAVHCWRICGATVPPMTAACGSFRTKARVIWVL